MPDKNILIILGHPDSASFSAALADAYLESALAAGHNARLIRLGDLDFDPVLRHGYQQRQELEPGLVDIRDAISAAQHLVFVYPIWWGGMPALLKGMFDRVFLPGYAFRYREGSQFWDRLLSGRSAHALVCMDTPPWYFRLVYRMPGHNQMKRTILEFCGIKPVKISSFGPVRFATPQQRERWLDQARALARKA